MKTRTFILHGYTIDVYSYEYATFMYPSFNGNAEFKATNTGFRALSHYLRLINYIKDLMHNR
jgi:hypothetical protein